MTNQIYTAVNQADMEAWLIKIFAQRMQIGQTSLDIRPLY